MKIQDLETPALILDADEYAYNAAKMQAILDKSEARLRPHYKSHKCVTIAKRQIADGAKGITCAKLSEAEDLVDAGITDVLIANQIVQKSKISRLAHLANKCKLTVCVDSAQNVKEIGHAARHAGSTIYCYVEYDIGMSRCGVFSFEEAYVLAKCIEEEESLVFSGIQAYAGQIAHSMKSEREAQVAANEARLTELVKYLEMRGITVNEISGGSTGTAEFKAKHGIYTELQAGSYLFLDTSYGVLDTPFKNALFVATTVISKNAHSIITDAGLKSIASDQGPAKCVEYPEKTVELHEEHGAIPWENAPVEVGEQLWMIPGHCCTTINLYDKLYIRRGEDIIDVMDVTSRGKSL